MRSPAGARAGRPAFSRRDFRGGFLLALTYIGASDVVQFARRPYDGMSARDFWIVESSSVLVGALGVGAAAGLWRAVSQLRALGRRPVWFTPRPAAVGAGARGPLVLAPNSGATFPPMRPRP